MTRQQLLKSNTVRGGIVLGCGLFAEAFGRLADRLDLLSDMTCDLLRYSGQGLVGVAVPFIVMGLRKALEGGK